MTTTITRVETTMRGLLVGFDLDVFSASTYLRARRKKAGLEYTYRGLLTCMVGGEPM
jgi:hypothetical protein